MKFTIPIDAKVTTNNKNYKGFATGLFTQLRLAGDQETVIDSGTEIGTSGVYEFEVTGNNLYLLLELWICATENGIYEKVESWGGTDGKTIESLNILDPADFNGGVPRSNGTSFSNMSIDVGTATNDMLMWNGTKWEKKTLAEAYAIISIGAYKTFKAKISQNGTGIPLTQQIYINDFGITPTWEYVGVGVYKTRNLISGLVPSKFHRYAESFPVYKNDAAEPTTSLQGYCRLSINSDGYFQIETFNTSFAPANTVLRFHQTIEFIYNN